MIADDPDLRAECQAALPVLRDLAMTPAKGDEIMQILGKRFALYPQPARTDAEWSAWWSDFLDTLKDLPPAALEAGMAAYVKLPDSEFFPKPGRIWALAKEAPNEAARAYTTAHMAVQTVARLTSQQLNWTDTAKPAERKPMTEGERQQAQEAVRKMVKETIAVLTPLKSTVIVRPNYAQVDQTGISERLREVVANQRAHQEE